MVKCYHDWNSHIETWENDGRVFKEPPEPMTPLIEVFAIDFLRFDGPDPDRTLLRGTVTLEYGFNTFYAVFKSDEFRTVRVGRFDALIGLDLRPGRDMPLDGDGNVVIHTALEDKTHGKLYLGRPSAYTWLQSIGADLTDQGPHQSNETLLWNIYCYGNYDRDHETLQRRPLAGPHCALDILFAVYEDGVAATLQLTLLASQPNSYDPDLIKETDVCGKVTARNTVLTDPQAYSTLFDRTTCDFAHVLSGDSIPLSKPSVVVPATSSLLLDLDLEYRVPSSCRSYHSFLKTKSSFQVPALQPFQSSVDIVSPDADRAIARLKVEVKWTKY